MSFGAPPPAGDIRAESNGERLLLLGCAAFLVVVTCAHWLTLPILLTWDGHQYVDLAGVVATPAFPRDWAWLRTPLFPLALKFALASFGRNPWAAMAVPTAMGLAGSLLTASCVRRLAGARAASVTLVGLALYPTLVAYEHAILTETGTFFFAALALRVFLVQTTTPAAAWGRALALGVTLGAGFYWRQTVLFLVPWLALMELVALEGSPRAWRRRAGRVLLIVGVPLWMRSLWHTPPTMGRVGVRISQAFTIRQMVLPAGDPELAPVDAAYRQAVRDTHDRGSLSGIPWAEVSKLQSTLPPPEESGTLAYLAARAQRYPARYARGVARAAIFFLGFDGAENANAIYRSQVLSPEHPGAKIEAGPPATTEEHRRAFFHASHPNLLQRVLWRSLGVADVLLIGCNLSTLGLCGFAAARRNVPLLAFAGAPVAFAVSHAILLLSINRFMLPIYPLTVAGGVLCTAFAARALARPSRASDSLRTNVSSRSAIGDPPPADADPRPSTNRLTTL